MDYSQHYGDIVKQYPAYVTQKQAAKICRTAIRKVRSLEKHGELRYKDDVGNGHRHAIALNDVLKYLYQKDCLQTRESEYMTRLRRFYADKLAQRPDVLLTNDISEITGYGHTAVVNWVNRGLLKAYKGSIYSKLGRTPNKLQAGR